MRLVVSGLYTRVWSARRPSGSQRDEITRDHSEHVLNVHPPSPCILEGCAHIQLTTCICRYRFAGFGVMILTVIVEMFRHPFEGETHTSHAPYLSNLSAIDMGGFSLLFSTAGVCQVHQCALGQRPQQRVFTVRGRLSARECEAEWSGS